MLSKEDLMMITARRLMNTLNNTKDLRMEYVATEIAEFLIDSEMVTEETLFKIQSEAQEQK